MDLRRHISDLASGLISCQQLSEAFVSAGEAGVQAALELSDSEVAFAGPEIWEAVLALGAKLVPAADTLISRIIALSKPRELLIAWTVANTTLLQPSSSHNALSTLLQEEDSLIDRVKLLSCQCLAGIIAQLDSRNYCSLVMDSMETFQAILCMEAKGPPEHICSVYVGDIVRVMTERIGEAKEEAMKKTYIETALVFLGLLDARFHSICIDLLLGLVPDLQSFLLHVPSFNSSSPIYSSYTKGLLHLASQSPALSLPAVLSPLYLLQLLLPTIHLALFHAPEQAVALLDQTLVPAVRLASVLTPFLYFPKPRKPTVAFLLDMLELMGRTEDDTKRKKTIAVFKRLLGAFDAEVTHISA